MSASQHRASAPAALQVRVAVLSVSDTRTLQTDEGGALIEALSTSAGYASAGRDLVRDEPHTVRAWVMAHAAAGDCDAILVTGGTGFAPRDGTFDAVAPLFERRIDGFGELFRALSFAEIGPAAMMSRAAAGIVGRAAVFLMPGSPAAIRLALDRLILPELAHLVGELRRSPDPSSNLDAPAHPRAHVAGHGDPHRR